MVNATIVDIGAIGLLTVGSINSMKGQTTMMETQQQQTLMQMWCS